MPITIYFLLLAFGLPALAIGDVGSRDGTILNPDAKDWVAPLERAADPGLFNTAMSAAVRWQKAVVARDVEALTEFALPEYKKTVKSELSDPRSVLHRFFFGETNSMYNLFRDSMEVKVALIAHRTRKDGSTRPEGITACYYDSKRVDPHSREDILGLMTLQGMSVAQCIYFFESKGHWHSNFEYNIEPDDE